MNFKALTLLPSHEYKYLTPLSHKSNQLLRQRHQLPTTVDSNGTSFFLWFFHLYIICCVLSYSMAEPLSSSSPPMDTMQHSGAQHTTLPAEIWVNIFGQVSQSPDHSLAPLAAVCRGWQHEVEKLTFSEIVVQPTTDDIANLRRVLENSRRANIMSKITFRGLSELEMQAFHLSEEPDILNLTAHKICQFFLCLGSTARESSYPPLTLTFDGWDDPRGAPPNTLLDSDIVERTLGAYSPSDCRIKHLVLPLERQLWPSNMFADMVRFCSPELKKIDLGLISMDNEEAEYNTCEYRDQFCGIPRGKD